MTSVPASAAPAPGTPAGNLTVAAADRLGLSAGTPVSAAIIDAHAGVPGAGAAEAGTLVMVLGTSSCHMLNALDERRIGGIAGIVKDGILPGYTGYETGQAAVGDLFDWFRRLAGEPTFAALDERAAAIGPGADGVVCLDWMNGCRTPLMNGALRGCFAGLCFITRRPICIEQPLKRQLLACGGSSNYFATATCRSRNSWPRAACRITIHY